MTFSVLLQLPTGSDSVAAVTSASSGFQLLPTLFAVVVVFGLLFFLLWVLKNDKQFPAVPTKSTHSNIPAEKSTELPKSDVEKGKLSSFPIRVVPEVPSKTALPPTTQAVIPDVPKIESVLAQIPSALPDTRPEVVPTLEDTPRGQIKYIGYHPVNVFAQTEPLHFPYVLLPAKEKCVVKFPRKGRVGRRGYKEADFLKYLTTHFQQAFKLYNDRLLLIKEGTQPFEPDITLIDEQNGLNLFIDIEIDEPYEGTNDIATRQPMHYQALDANRNNAFRNRGWAVIRFAEIQVHQQPLACCRFIADVVASINPKFSVPSELLQTPVVTTVAQWTKEQAQEWSKLKYRESYLGINRFGETDTVQRATPVVETEEGKQEEAQVQDEPLVATVVKRNRLPTNEELVATAIQSGQYLSFSYVGQPTVVKPQKWDAATKTFTAHCYVKNADKAFKLINVSNLLIKPNYYVDKLGAPAITVDKVRALIQVAIRNKKYIRMTYTTSSFNGVGGSTSLRTISDVQRSVDILSAEQIRAYNLNEQVHISAYCHYRSDQRTFHYARMSEVAILAV
jgi:hypothetical protein